MKDSGGSDHSNENEDKPSVDKSKTKDQKKKFLRFAEQEEIIERTESHHSEHRFHDEEQNVFGIRVTPLPFPQTSRATDMMRSMRADLADDDSASSLYLESESRVTLPQTFPYEPIFYALRRSPTKSQVDYNLLMSVILRNLEGVMQAIEEGANVNTVQDRQTPLVIAVENNDRPIVKYLVNIHAVDLDYRNTCGQTPLMIALRNGSDEIALILMEAGANARIPDNLGRTPLHEALFQENYDMVIQLLKHEGPLNMIDSFEERPIYTCSVKKPNLKLLNILLEAGASCEYSNISGISLLSRAILYSTSFPVIRRLIEAGADVNSQDRFCGRTPLHMATTINSLPVVKLLLENKADPNLKTISGLTPFDLSLYYNHIDICEYLAPITTNPMLRADTIKNTLMRRLPNFSSTLFLLKTGIHSKANNRKSNSYK